MLNTLDEFLNRMTAITVRAEEHLASITPVGIAELTKARGEQSRIITSYQLFVHREVFEPMIASADVADKQRVRTLKAECIVLAEDYRTFARSWTAEDVASNWASYRAAALDFVSRIRQHAANVRATAPAFLGDRRPSAAWQMPA
jgi:hypothetical protein